MGNTGLIVGVIIGSLILVAVVGVIIYKRRSYTKINSETSKIH